MVTEIYKKVLVARVDNEDDKYKVIRQLRDKDIEPIIVELGIGSLDEDIKL